MTSPPHAAHIPVLNVDFLLSAKQKAPAQLFVTQLNSPRGLFNETNMHEAVAHPNQSGCMMMFGSESVHLELFILGKG